MRSLGRRLVSWILQVGLVLLLLLLLATAPVRADTLRVAVASNFKAPLTRLIPVFEAATGHRVLVSAGSTGRLYAQIRHGAPHDVFLAADAERPRRLEEEGLIAPGGRFVYALGRLALWSTRITDNALLENRLREGHLESLAIANPSQAPYGRAARQVLEGMGRWLPDDLRRITGEDVGQTFVFVASGNAEAGFVALSQIEDGGTARPGGRWIVPAGLHEPIRQEGVILARSRDLVAAADFRRFLLSEDTEAVLRGLGYETP